MIYIDKIHVTEIRITTFFNFNIMAFLCLISLYSKACCRGLAGSLWSPPPYSCCHGQGSQEGDQGGKMGESNIQPLNICHLCTWASFIRQWERCGDHVDHIWIFWVQLRSNAREFKKFFHGSCSYLLGRTCSRGLSGIHLVSTSAGQFVLPRRFKISRRLTHHQIRGPTVVPYAWHGFTLPWEPN